MTGWRYFALILSLGSSLHAQPKRILYLTHSAGFRHDSLAISSEVLRSIAAASGKLEITTTDDVGLLNARTLSSYDAVFFFTSGELPISDSQKRDLLDFVRSGHGFGGAHSATDTFYTWPDYGAMIGAYFNGHPWVQQVKIDAEDRDHPASAPGAPWFVIQEEVYQFRNFSRENTRVLQRLDPSSVDLTVPDVNRATLDFPLAWTRAYGSGRVFYTALGHFDETWRDARFQKMLLGAMLWLTGQAEGSAAPQPFTSPVVAASGNSASLSPRNAISPGTIFSIFGANLTTGATAAADLRSPAMTLAGTSLTVNGEPVSLFYASPSQVNAYAPPSLTGRVCVTVPCPAVVAELRTPVGTVETWLDYKVRTPGLFILTATRSDAVLWMTGLGPVQRSGALDQTVIQPTVTVGGVPARVQFSGLSPGWLGLYQVNIEVPPGTTFPARLDFRMGDAQVLAFINP